jgi:hypothetical protein
MNALRPGTRSGDLAQRPLTKAHMRRLLSYYPATGIM